MQATSLEPSVVAYRATMSCMDSSASGIGALSNGALGDGALGDGASNAGALNIGALIVTTTQRAPFAVVASNALRAHHPNIDITVVVVDDRFREVARANRNDATTWLAASEAIGHDHVVGVLAEYGADDAIALLTPELVHWALQQKSPQSHSAVVLLSDHVFVQHSLAKFVQDVLTSPTGDQSIGLIRVRADVPVVDGRLPDARDLFTYGHMQRGFVVFGSASDESVRWWLNQTQYQEREDSRRLNRLSHPWLDYLAVRNSSPPLVGDAELIGSFRNADCISDHQACLAIDFDGFDPRRPWILSELAGNWPRVLLSEHQFLQDLTRQYADDVLAVQLFTTEPPYERLANGHPYDAAMRHVYRDLAQTARREGTPPPPNPFTESDSFVARLAEPHPNRPGLSRHLEAWAQQRPDLDAAFAHDTAAFWKWAGTDALNSHIWTPLPPEQERGIPPCSDRHHGSGDRASEAGGLNVVGLLSAQLGVGEHGRLALHSVRDSGIPFSIIDHDDTIHQREPSTLDGWPANGFAYDIDLLLVNADQTETALRHFGRPGHPLRTTIGLWAWEVPSFPDRFHSAYDLVSEVWVLSDFVRQALTPSASEHGREVVVYPIPLPYVRERHKPSHYEDMLTPLGLNTARPFFSFMFDYFSVAERKQPWRTIEAFMRAFPIETQNGPQLVIKSMNHRYFPVERERTRLAARGRSDVIFIEEYLPVVQRDALVSAATAYVSLHRAEGFGLTLAEAMGAGTPCIATSWSGNLDFMSSQNSFLVDVELVDIPISVPAYGGLGRWAEPSVDHGASLMQFILDQPDVAAAKAAQAVVDLQQRNHSGADAQFVLERVRRLRSTRPLPGTQGAIR
jgi:glycosyltransferase involved in cell wall biosynthesis